MDGWLPSELSIDSEPQRTFHTASSSFHSHGRIMTALVTAIGLDLKTVPQIIGCSRAKSEVESDRGILSVVLVGDDKR